MMFVLLSLSTVGIVAIVAAILYGFKQFLDLVDRCEQMRYDIRELIAAENAIRKRLNEIDRKLSDHIGPAN